MRIAVCCKFTPDTEDIVVEADGSIDAGKAMWKVSDYDLQAIQVGKQLAEASDGDLIAISVGDKKITQSNLTKALLSRGPNSMMAVLEEGLFDTDAATVGRLLAAAVRTCGADVVLFGEGSADRYFKQTGVQTGAELGWPTVNNVCEIKYVDGDLQTKRELENSYQLINLQTPCALSVTASINNPPVPSMREVLAAGKKPVEVRSPQDLGIDKLESAYEVVANMAPETPDRKQVVIEGPAEEAVTALIDKLKNESVL